MREKAGGTPTRVRLLRGATLLLLVVLALAAGCSRSPEARKARHLERGDHYFKEEKYRDAVIEYRNVLRIEAANAQAMRQLGLAHFQLGEMGQAFRFLLRAQEGEPDNAEVRLKLATRCPAPRVSPGPASPGAGSPTRSRAGLRRVTRTGRGWIRASQRAGPAGSRAGTSS